MKMLDIVITVAKNCRITEDKCIDKLYFKK